MSTEGKLTIYKALVRPHVEYGAEVVDAGAWEEAEEMQRWVGKRILLAGKRIPDEVVQGELGLLSLRGRRAMLRLTSGQDIANEERTVGEAGIRGGEGGT